MTKRKLFTKYNITEKTPLITINSVNMEAFVGIAEFTGTTKEEVFKTAKDMWKGGVKPTFYLITDLFKYSQAFRFVKYNAKGITTDELAEELGINESWLLNKANWTYKNEYNITNPLTLPNGKKVDIYNVNGKYNINWR